MTFGKVILHCDLDCFYAQVERERLGMPQDAAVAVVQWQMALAVSYPARKYNIKRGSSVDEIRKLAGDKVTIVHVETIGADSSTHSTVERQDGSDVVNTEKVSLARYRKASGQVFAAMTAALSGYNAKLERASVDEAYIDVTVEVDKRVANLQGCERAWPAETNVVGEKLCLDKETDLRLAFGADIAAKIREKVFADCSFTVSAGISMNKLLAKFASAQNKPNMQTVVPMTATSGLLQNVPIRKLRGLGGKLGKEVEALGIATCGDAVKVPMQQLEHQLGHRKVAEFVFNSVRGIDDSEVIERDKTKSLLAAKSFKGQLSLTPVEQQWLPILADELVERLIEDSDLNNRDSKTLTVTFRAKPKNGSEGMAVAARSTIMPVPGDGRAKAIQASAIRVLRKAMLEDMQFLFPISFIGLTATNFSERAGRDENIKQYFACDQRDDIAKSSVCQDQRLHSSERFKNLSRAEAQQIRLQERADKEMALRLHREQFGSASQKRSEPLGIAKRQKMVKSGRKGKSKSKEQANTMDKFVFKKTDRKPQR